MRKGRISLRTCCDRLLTVSGKNSVKFILHTEMNSRWAKYFKVKKREETLKAIEENTELNENLDCERSF